MVRLKADCEANSAIPEVEFQFLYGTIKRTTSIQVLTRPKNFNSYMVRLKDCLLIHIFSYPYNFNSYMVRLKAGVFFS